ncbi:MAG: hypothetical protein SFX19_03885 [Alphaproteobacteria bacterium]|nr:hypothetical protein [Alphaproteobacteria bacterium]
MNDKKQEMQDRGLTGLGTDNEVLAAQLATNTLGHMAAPAGLAVDLYAADVELHRNIQAATSMMGEDTRTLKAGSPAFRKYIKEELPEVYGDRAMGFVAAITGGAVALGLAGMVFGLPGGFLGMLAGLTIGAVGSIGGNYIKNQFFPSDYNTFLDFAANLQNLGQQKQMTPETAFVALVMNMPDERSRKDVMATLPKRLRVKNEKDLIRLLASDEGREALRMAMVENDAALRAGVGALSTSPQVTISEQFAQLVNQQQVAGVDLLNGEKTGHIGMLIANHETMQFQQSQEPQDMAQANPNTHLPTPKANQLGV